MSLCPPPSTAFQNSETPTTLDFHRRNVWGHLLGMCKSPLVLSKHIPGCHVAANPLASHGAHARVGCPTHRSIPGSIPGWPTLKTKHPGDGGCARMRDTHPRPLGWGSLQMLPCFNAAQQGMTHPSVPPHHLPNQLEMDALISPQQQTLFGIRSVKLLAVSCCCCFSPRQGV